MKFNKQIQYGMLFTLYLCRTGYATVDATAKELGLSRSFLEQVTGRLRRAGILQVKRGPGGGYSLNGNPTVAQLFTALKPVQLIAPSEAKTLHIGTYEQRSLLNFATVMNRSVTQVLNRTIRSVGNDMLVAETALLEKAEARA